MAAGAVVLLLVVSGRGVDSTAWVGAETGEAITACQRSTSVSEVVFACPA